MKLSNLRFLLLIVGLITVVLHYAYQKYPRLYWIHENAYWIVTLCVALYLAWGWIDRLSSKSRS